MRYAELKFNDKVYKSESEISEILKGQKFYWLIDSEIENAVLEIKRNTLIWHDGEFLSGYWHYGIFKKGSFFGVWEGGIFEGDDFKGIWAMDKDFRVPTLRESQVK